MKREAEWSLFLVFGTTDAKTSITGELGGNTATPVKKKPESSSAQR